MIRWCVSALILIFALGVALSMQFKGESSRRFVDTRSFLPVAPIIVRNTTDLYPLWKEQKIHGRLVVHFGRFIHFVAINDEELYEPSGHFPSHVYDPTPFYEERIERNNILRVAMRAGLVRTIFYVMSDARFEYVQQLLRDDPLVKVGDKEIVMHEFGSMQKIVRSLESFPSGEPVVMNIDATFMADVSPEETLAILRSGNVQYDILTLCLAEDNPYVTPVDRERLLELAAMMRQ
ncbi:hypothetical protein ACFLZI_03950 [Nitrospirota bacterium]